MDPANPNATGQHYLAEIKYPTIPDPISLEKILNVLQKIRFTSKPLSFRWSNIERPKHGELFLEQKYPLTRDPVNGDQFPIIDDGYLWSSIPRPEVKEVSGQLVEIYRWTEGYSAGDACFTVLKTEYRLRLPGNVLFLIHYLLVKNPCVPVRPALPASKVSPIYLQQQYHIYLQQLQQQQHQQQAQKSNVSVQPTRTSSPKPPPVMTSSTPAATTTTTTTTKDANPTNEPNMDLLDGFTEYDAAAYRYTLGKTVLMSIFDSRSTSSNSASSNTALSSHPGLTEDLIAAVKRKCETIDSRITLHKTEHSARVESMLEARAQFVAACEAIQKAANEEELAKLMHLLESDMDGVQEEPVFISL